MGDWSEYFEDFPDENQANYAGDRFDPVGAKVQHQAQQKSALKLRNEQQQLDAEIAAIVQKHKPVT